jgi:shikimate dehydrogenase
MISDAAPTEKVPEITGTTRVYYMMAHPIAHVTTPEVFNPMCVERGVDAVMIPMHVTPENLPQAFETFRKTENLGGIVISVPLKQSFLDLSDEAHDRATELGAANCVRRMPDGRMVCDNFDGEGFMAGLAEAEIDVRGGRVLLVGAGGAGSALGFSLAKAGVAEIVFSDRDSARAEALCARVKAATADPILMTTITPPSPAGHDIIINATDSGLHEGDPLPIVADELEPGHIVCDIIMKPHETALLTAAKAHGCMLHHGRNMLDGQMELFWDFFGLPR